MSVKANKEFGSPKNEGNRTTKNEMNEVFGEEDEGLHNKSFYINRKDLKDNSKKTSRGKVVEYKISGKQERL